MLPRTERLARHHHLQPWSLAWAAGTLCCLTPMTREGREDSGGGFVLSQVPPPTSPSPPPKTHSSHPVIHKTPRAHLAQAYPLHVPPPVCFNFDHPSGQVVPNRFSVQVRRPACLLGSANSKASKTRSQLPRAQNTAQCRQTSRHTADEGESAHREVRHRAAQVCQRDRPFGREGIGELLTAPSWRRRTRRWPEEEG